MLRLQRVYRAIRIVNDADAAPIPDEDRHRSNIATRPQSRLCRIQQFRGVVGESAHSLLIAPPIQTLNRA